MANSGSGVFDGVITIGLNFAERMRARAEHFKNGPMWGGNQPTGISLTKDDVATWKQQVEALLDSTFGDNSDERAKWDTCYADRETATPSPYAESTQSSLDQQHFTRCVNLLRGFRNESRSVSKAEEFITAITSSIEHVWKMYGVMGVILLALVTLILLALNYGETIMKLLGYATDG